MADVGVQLYNPEDLNERWFPVTTSDLVSVDGGGSLSDSLDNFKTKQTAVQDPTASGTGVTFIDTISQDTNGVITPHKATVRTATLSQSGLMTANDKQELARLFNRMTPELVIWDNTTLDYAVRDFFDSHDSAGDLTHYQDILFYAGSHDVIPSSGTDYYIEASSLDGLFYTLTKHEPHTKFNIYVQRDFGTFSRERLVIRRDENDLNLKILMANGFVDFVTGYQTFMFQFFQTKYGTFADDDKYQGVASFSIEYFGLELPEEEVSEYNPHLFVISYA